MYTATEMGGDLMYFFCAATKNSCVYMEKHEPHFDDGYDIRWECVAELADEGKSVDEIIHLLRRYAL